jgi:hypothetical protein
MGSTIGGIIGGQSGAGNAAASVGSYYPNIFQNSQNYMTLAGQNMANADTLQTTAAPAATNTFNQAYNNPYAGQMQAGAGQAGNALNSVGTQGLNNSTALSSAANSLLPGAQQVMQQGLDPQSALFNQQQQLVRDQSNVTNAQNGIQGPYAAGNVNQNLQNFDINWQNNALQRAIQGLQAGGAAVNQAGAGQGQAQSLGQTGAQNIYSGAGLPYNTANQITGNQSQDINTLISSLGGINNIDSATMESLLQYMGAGSNYAIAQNQNEMKNSAAGAQAGSLIGGQLFGGLSNMTSFMR